MKKVLFVSRKADKCGVADYGRRVNEILQKSKMLSIIWAEIENDYEYINLINEVNPDVVLYNYYGHILPFITDEFLKNYRHIPHIMIYHENTKFFTPTAIIDTDSTKQIFLNIIFILPQDLYLKILILWILKKIQYQL